MNSVGGDNLGSVSLYLFHSFLSFPLVLLGDSDGELLHDTFELRSTVLW